MRARTTVRTHSHSFHRFATMHMHHRTVRATLRASADKRSSPRQPHPAATTTHRLRIIVASDGNIGGVRHAFWLPPLPRPRRFVVCCCRRKPQSERRQLRSRTAGTSPYLVHTDAGRWLVQYSPLIVGPAAAHGIVVQRRRGRFVDTTTVHVHDADPAGTSGGRRRHIFIRTHRDDIRGHRLEYRAPSPRRGAYGGSWSARSNCVGKATDSKNTWGQIRVCARAP